MSSKSIKRPTNISTAHILGFVYYFQSSIDGCIDDIEVETIIKKIAKWIPQDTNYTDYYEIIEDAAMWFSSAARNGKLVREMEAFLPTLRNVYAPDELHKIFGDMLELANADGELSPEEQIFIKKATKLLGIHSAD